MDAATVIAAATAPRPSPPWRPDLAAPKALMLLCLASLWVGFAAAGAAAVTVAACGHGEASPVFRVLAETTVRATVLALLLAPVSMVLVLRAAVCDAGFREDLIRHGQASRASARSMLREAIVRAFIAALAFALLRVIGSLVLMGLSPAKGSRTGRPVIRTPGQFCPSHSVSYLHRRRRSSSDGRAPGALAPDLAAAKALGLLCLASLSVGFAAVGTSSVAIAACDYDEACAVRQVLDATAVRALVFAALLAPIAPLLVVRAAVCDAGFREELIISVIRHLQAPRVPVRSFLREDVVRAFLAALAFTLPSIIGCTVLVVLSPAKGSWTGRIGAMLAIVGEEIN
ncbi:hypothetical protein C2845_PM14G14470 [Panicum miliaceum]|uniref:Uncharacterized protein n=1 Tax=Panicum miliaceum TaxID=4540 RepID=A0A3L6PMW9_PANMI|nr:hypothetical protein C2845_PM14G14470 [Panicum miliaceum]